MREHYRAARPSCDRSSEISVVLGKRIQGCATSKARFEPKNYTWFSRRVQQRARNTTKSFLSLSRAASYYTNDPPAKEALPISVPTLLDQAQDFGQRCRDRT